MGFEYLDKESEEKLKELLIITELPKQTMSGSVIEHLSHNGYIECDMRANLSAGKRYLFRGVTQKGRSYFELKELYEKEKKRISRREWIIAIVSAAIGAVIGLLPSLFNLISNKNP